MTLKLYKIGDFSKNVKHKNTKIKKRKVFVHHFGIEASVITFASIPNIRKKHKLIKHERNSKHS